MLTKSNKKSLGFLSVAVGVFLLLLAFYTKKEGALVVEETYEAPYEDVLISESVDKKEIIEPKEIAVLREPANLKSSTLTFKEKSKEILALAENFKENKLKLIEVASSKDVFKVSGEEPKPHTVDDIIQQQEGALRVLALRLLMKNESKENLKHDLSTIMKEAKDPTMSKIAEAALKSVEAGRPFFKDLPDAIERL